ncbi:helicase associated domain-containing protein [Arthrobacter sp.]|uniref:helicase associated domain-containing protein n=1 Tax=Arthrobacter sp. TaxID=1667 RepID=UPI003A913E22
MARDPASRVEWLLLYQRGLEPNDIARICHTLPRTAEAFIRGQLEQDPNLFDTRLCRCLEPSLPVFRAEDSKRGWHGNRLSLARFVQAHGRFPRSAADTTTVSGALEVSLYHWMRAQRSASAAGHLTARQERQLESISRWTVLGRDQMNDRHWVERITTCRAFIDNEGRLPAYRGGSTDHERSLGAWLSRQRSRARRGALPMARVRVCVIDYS